MFGRPSCAAAAGRAWATEGIRSSARAVRTHIVLARMGGERTPCVTRCQLLYDGAGMATETQQMASAGRRTRARLSRRESRQRIVTAATELVRERSYAELSVDAVMREAGLGRTIFYRHFDDLADLLMGTGR